MHYCTLLFTEKLPTEKEIEGIMSPYYEGNAEYDEDGYRIGEYPQFEWDWYQIGGRYSGNLKLLINENDEYYNWKHYAREDRNKRLFYSYLLTQMKGFAGNTFRYREEDYFPSMGFRDGFLYVDGARVDDILNIEEQNCYICISADGTVIARERWDGKSFVQDDEFDKKLYEIVQQSKGKFVTVLDIHN